MTSAHHPIRWVERALGVGDRVPLARAAGRRWPRLDSYPAHPRISRQHHSSRWSGTAAAPADLLTAPGMVDTADRQVPSTLRLLTFQRLTGTAENS